MVGVALALTLVLVLVLFDVDVDDHMFFSAAWNEDVLGCCFFWTRALVLRSRSRLKVLGLGCFEHCRRMQVCEA